MSNVLILCSCDAFASLTASCIILSSGFLSEGLRQLLDLVFKVGNDDARRHIRGFLLSACCAPSSQLQGVFESFPLDEDEGWLPCFHLPSTLSVSVSVVLTASAALTNSLAMTSSTSTLVFTKETCCFTVRIQTMLIQLIVSSISMI